MAFLVGNGATVFTLRQDGTILTGNVEGMGGGFFGGTDAPVPIQEGKVDGQNVSFKVGTSTFDGTLKGDQLELLRTMDLSRWLTRLPKEPVGPRPAVGPPPDGSDPSFNLPSRLPSGVPVVLRRAQR
jgi:beta-galactosidase